MAKSGLTAVSQHYLEVQALSPDTVNQAQSSAPAATNNPLPANLFSSTPLVIFTSLIIFTGISLLAIKLKNWSQIITLLFIAFMTSTIPFGVNLLTSETRLQSMAGPEYIPRKVVVTDVSSSGFTVAWETDKPGRGSIRYRDTAEITPFTKIVSETEGEGVYKHVLTLTDLDNNTDYYFEILSGDTWYNNQGEPIQVKTAAAN